MKEYIRVLLMLFIGLIPSLFFGSTDISLEAENAVLSGGYSIEYNDNASNNSFVKLENSAPKNGAITFTLEGIPSDGTYKIEVFHFNGATNQSVDISILQTPVSVASCSRDLSHHDSGRDASSPEDRNC